MPIVDSDIHRRRVENLSTVILEARVNIACFALKVFPLDSVVMHLQTHDIIMCFAGDLQPSPNGNQF